MTQEQFITKAGKVANIFLAAGGVAFVLVFLYIVYRRGPAGGILYFAIPLIVSGLLFASLKLHPIYKINIVILGFSLALCGYGAEAYLYFSNPMPYEIRKPITAIDGAPRWKKERAKNFAKQFGVDFDTRDTVEVVADLRNRGVDAVPFVSPSNNLFKKQPDGSIRLDIKIGGEHVVPLAGIASRITVLCNEGGDYVTYPSDLYGFNNPANVWKTGAIEIAALGDSFAQGYCVPPEKNFVAAIRDRYPTTVNLGIAGDGPLLMLATLKEYLPPRKPRIVLWFYFEGNDLTGLQDEKKISPLLSYLKDDFSQGLRERQSAIDQALIGYVEQVSSRRRQNRSKDDDAGRGHLIEFIKLSGLRARSGLTSTIDKDEEDAGSEANMALFREVLSRAKETVGTWGGKIFFVYLPTWDRYANHFGSDGLQRAEVLSYVKSLDISLIDIHPVFQSQPDPLSLFPFREPSHYNEKGHSIVAAEVLKALASAPAGMN